MKLAHAGLAGDLGELDGVGEVGLDVGEGALEARGG